MPLFDVTYQTWSDKALEIGETDEKGYISRGVKLRDAIMDLLQGRGNVSHPTTGYSTVGVYMTPGHDDVEAYTMRDLHIPDGVTASSRARIIRLIQAQ